jgi:hypothetical protein
VEEAKGFEPRLGKANRGGKADLGARGVLIAGFPDQLICARRSIVSRRHSMGNFGGFGPSTGRTAEVCESPETSVKMATMEVRSTPPVVLILSFTAAFLSFVFGVTFIYEDRETLGAGLLILAAALVVAPIIWTIKNR